MRKGWFFSSCVDYSIGLTLVHERGYSASEAVEFMAKNLWRDQLKKFDIVRTTNELWAR